jgi:hypothetical protein
MTGDSVSRTFDSNSVGARKRNRASAMASVRTAARKNLSRRYAAFPSRR